jgi:hypothetical protein
MIVNVQVNITPPKKRNRRARRGQSPEPLQLVALPADLDLFNQTLDDEEVVVPMSNPPVVNLLSSEASEKKLFLINFRWMQQVNPMFCSTKLAQNGEII